MSVCSELAGGGRGCRARTDCCACAGVSAGVRAHTRVWCVCVCVFIAWADPSNGGGPGDGFVLTSKGDHCSSVLFLLGWWLAFLILGLDCLPTLTSGSLGKYSGYTSSTIPNEAGG